MRGCGVSVMTVLFPCWGCHFPVGEDVYFRGGGGCHFLVGEDLYFLGGGGGGGGHFLVGEDIYFRGGATFL